MATARRSAVNPSLPWVTKWLAHCVRRARVSGSHGVMWLASVTWWNWLRWASSVEQTAERQHQSLVDAGHQPRGEQREHVAETAGGQHQTGRPRVVAEEL